MYYTKKKHFFWPLTDLILRETKLCGEILLGTHSAIGH